MEPAPSSPGFYSRLFLVPKNGGQWRPIIDLSALNAFIDCPSFTMETPRVNSQGLKTRSMAYVPVFERHLLSNRDSSSRPTVPPFLSQRHLAVQSTAFWSLNQSKSFYQNTQTGTSLRPFTRGKATHVPGRLVVKPGFSSGSSRANILAQVPVPKIRAGHKSGEVGFNPFPESHLSGNRAGLPCRSGKTVREE